MRARTLTTMMLAAALAAPLLALPGTASASCSDRKVTGTVLGGVGGALIGGALGHGTGALIGGLGGAVIGHEVAAGGCHRYRYRRAYYDRSGPGYPPPPPPPARAVYYDQYGAVAPIGAGVAYQAQGAPGVCRTETRTYYDARGALTPVQVCVR